MAVSGMTAAVDLTLRSCMPQLILGDNPRGQPPLPPTENTPYLSRLRVLTLTDPRRGVLTITLTLTNPRGGELSVNWH